MDPDQFPDEFTVLHAPGYGPRFLMRQVRQAERHGADSIAYTEANRVAGRLEGRPVYDAVVGHSDVDTRRIPSPRGDAGDNPVAVHRRNRITRRHVERITKPGKPEKFAPERYVYSVTYRLGRTGHKVTHVSLHPSPKFCGLRPWFKVMRAGLAEVVRAKRLGHYVVLTGDLQDAGRLVYSLLRAAGLKVWREGIDYVAHNKRVRITERRVFEVDGFDHPWMLATLEEVPR